MKIQRVESVLAGHESLQIHASGALHEIEEALDASKDFFAARHRLLNAGWNPSPLSQDLVVLVKQVSGIQITVHCLENEDRMSSLETYRDAYELARTDIAVEIIDINQEAITERLSDLLGYRRGEPSAPLVLIGVAP